MMLIHEANFVAVDVETTGLNVRRDEIVAIAMIPIVNMKILLKDAFFSLVKPVKFRIESMKYHGISDVELEEAPLFEEIAEEVLSRCKGILVGHCVEIDYSFLERAFKRLGKPFKRSRVDIVEIEKWIRHKTCHGPKWEELNLDALINYYGLKGCFRHNPLADAFFAAQIFQIQIMSQEIKTVEHLMEILSHQKVCLSI
ncbi:MAG: 3'-5' exonuclease [Syntrophobacterales bacterium]|nr:3'-5' exonuclease [Syntrophobacterales bacterium]